MKDLFERTLEENQKYVALLDRDATEFEQVAQLQVCKSLMNEIRDKGLLKEYAEHCRIRNLRKSA